MIETEYSPQPETLTIPDGLSCMILPDLHGVDEDGDPVLKTEDEVVANMNAFLHQLTLAGADIKHIISVTVDKGENSAYIARETAEKQLLILEKKQK